MLFLVNTSVRRAAVPWSSQSSSLRSNFFFNARHWRRHYNHTGTPPATVSHPRTLSCQGTAVRTSVSQWWGITVVTWLVCGFVLPLRWPDNLVPWYSFLPNSELQYQDTVGVFSYNISSITCIWITWQYFSSLHYKEPNKISKQRTLPKLSSAKKTQKQLQ